MIRVVIILIILFLCINYFLFLNENFEGRPKIWMYWETLPEKTKPGYIDLCIESVKWNCKNCFDIHVLDNISINKYLPEIKNIDLSSLELPQKVDYYRYCLLEKYGGPMKIEEYRKNSKILGREYHKLIPPFLPMNFGFEEITNSKTNKSMTISNLINSNYKNDNITIKRNKPLNNGASRQIDIFVNDK